MFAAARQTDTVTHDLLVSCGQIGPPPSGPCPQGPVIIEGQLAAHAFCTCFCFGATAAGPMHPPGIPFQGPISSCACDEPTEPKCIENAETPKEDEDRDEPGTEFEIRLVQGEQVDRSFGDRALDGMPDDATEMQPDRSDHTPPDYEKWTGPDLTPTPEFRVGTYDFEIRDQDGNVARYRLITVNWIIGRTPPDVKFSGGPWNEFTTDEPTTVDRFGGVTLHGIDLHPFQIIDKAYLKHFDPGEKDNWKNTAEPSKGWMYLVDATFALPPMPLATPILNGSPTVWIHALPAARWAPSGDTTACGLFLGDMKCLSTRTVFFG